MSAEPTSPNSMPIFNGSITRYAQITETLHYENKTKFFDKKFGFIGKLPDYPRFMPGYVVYFNTDTQTFSYKVYVSTD